MFCEAIRDKLDKATVEELKKYDHRPLTEEEISKIAGGTGPDVSLTCPYCGSQMEREVHVFPSGPLAGMTVITVYCPMPYCGYHDSWSY